MSDTNYEPSRPHQNSIAIVDLKLRVDRLEKGLSISTREHYDLRAEIVGLLRDLTYIKVSQDKVAGGITRILWAIGLSVLAAGVTFVLAR